MPTLQQLIDAVISQAETDGMAKLAAEANEKRPLPKAEAERQAAREENQRAGGNPPGDVDKTASERITKLADAVQFIVDNLGGLTPSIGRVKLSADAVENNKATGPGVGPGSMDTNLNSPTAGTQSDVSGQAKQQIPQKPPISAKGQLEDNEEMKHAPQPDTIMKQAAPAKVPTKGYTALVKALKKVSADKNFLGRAKISAKKGTQNPEDAPAPALPAEAASQARLVDSNEGAIRYTKREAKVVPKKRLKEVLSEPAQTASTDKVLDQALGGDVVDRAGAKIAHATKIAAARVLLQKIASEGCKCDSEKGSCQFCKVAARLKDKKGLGKGAQVGVGPSPTAPTPTPGGITSGGAPTTPAGF